MVRLERLPQLVAVLRDHLHDGSVELAAVLQDEVVEARVHEPLLVLDDCCEEVQLREGNVEVGFVRRLDQGNSWLRKNKKLLGEGVEGIDFRGRLDVVEKREAEVGRHEMRENNRETRKLKRRKLDERKRNKELLDCEIVLEKFFDGGIDKVLAPALLASGGAN